MPAVLVSGLGLGLRLENWLLPEMKSNSLDLLPIPVVDAAHKAATVAL